MSLPTCPACQMSPRLKVGDFRNQAKDKPLMLRYCTYCGYTEAMQKGDLK